MSRPGIENGILVDPQQWFFSLVSNRDPREWPKHLAELNAEFNDFDVRQEINSSHEVRGRLYLPNESNDNEQRWVNVVHGQPGDADCRWVWDEHPDPNAYPRYVPLVKTPAPRPTPAPVPTPTPSPTPTPAPPNSDELREFFHDFVETFGPAVDALEQIAESATRISDAIAEMRKNGVRLHF